MMAKEAGPVVVLDASALIAAQNPSDPLHDAALTILDELSDRDWLMHPLTRVELLVGPARADGPQGVQEADDWLERFGVEVLDDAGAIDLQRPEVRRALALLRARTGVKLPDAVVLQLAGACRGTLVTGDRRLARAARDQGVDVEELQASS